MNFNNERFDRREWTSLPFSLLRQLNRLWSQIEIASPHVRLQVRDFVDASGGAQARSLPPIATNPDKDYYFVKTDASANAVTITPFGTDTVEGAASLSLAAQYDSALLIPHNGVWYIIP